jgi:uncharacterized protein with FMN-binding domain
MNRRIVVAHCLVGCLAAGWLAAADSNLRTWKDASGSFSVQAEFVDLRDGMVQLKRADGRTASVPLNRLSAADQQYVKEQGAEQSAQGPDDDAKEDGVELLSGAKLKGKISTRDEKSVTVEVSAGRRTSSRKIPLDRVAAITQDGKREVLHAPAAGDGPSASGSPAKQAGTAVRRTKAEVEALIEKMGRTPPDWWDSVPLNYPKSLDLAWTEPAPPPWNPQKNLGQYVWDVINPNPGKWREGVRLMHRLMSVHEDDPRIQLRAMNGAARMYQDLLGDYARAAFWWRKASKAVGGRSWNDVKLAECYWKLGNKQMAQEVLNEADLQYSTIKLLADMGDTAAALQIADAAAQGGAADLAYLYAGDACRVAGQHDKAIGYYEKVLRVPATGQAAKRIEHNQRRARANLEGVRLFDRLDLTQVADGKYRANSPGYAGEIHVEVEVQQGRIEAVRIVGHQEKQFYSALTDTPRKIIEKQGVKGIDATSSATITSEAIINATAKALSSAAN